MVWLICFTYQPTYFNSQQRYANPTDSTPHSSHFLALSTYFCWKIHLYILCPLHQLPIFLQRPRLKRSPFLPLLNHINTFYHFEYVGAKTGGIHSYTAWEPLPIVYAKPAALTLNTLEIWSFYHWQINTSSTRTFYRNHSNQILKDYNANRKSPRPVTNLVSVLGFPSHLFSAT